MTLLNYFSRLLKPIEDCSNVNDDCLKANGDVSKKNTNKYCWNFNCSLKIYDKLVKINIKRHSCVVKPKLSLSS